MGRHFQHEHSDIELEEYHPGCMWGIFHILDAHHLHNVKRRMIPHRKHHRGKHAFCCKTPRTISSMNDSVDEQGFMDHEAVPFLVEQKTTNSNPRNKSWRKPLVKAFIYKQMSAVERKPPSLPRTTEELVECIGYDSRRNVSDDCEKCDKVMNKQDNQSFEDANHLTRENSSYQVRDTENLINAFDANKELFLNSLKNQDISAVNHFHIHPGSRMKMRLTKSGTFPAADSSHIRFPRPSTLKHKQNEVWPLPYGFESLKSVPLKSGDMEGTATRQETKPSMDPELNNNGWHLSLKNHFKDVKRKIKHVLRERKERRYSLKNALLHRVPSTSSSINEKRANVEKLEGTVLCQDKLGEKQSAVAGASDNNLSNGHVSSIKRVSFLHASMDRYAKLFEFSFSKETNWKHSKSLSLTTEYRYIPGDHTLNFSRRRLSLSDLDSLPSFVNEVSLGAPLSRKPSRAIPDCDSRGNNVIHDVLEPVNKGAEKFEPVGGQSCMSFENEGGFVATRNYDEVGENIVESEKEQRSPREDQKTSFEMEPREDTAQPSSFQENITIIANLPICHGSEVNPQCNSFDEQKSSVNAEDNFSSESLSSGKTIRENNFAKPKVGDHFLPREFDKVAEAEFNYVKDVLELSGFMENNEHFGRWNLPEQPLDVSVFKELETYLHPECSAEEVGSSCDHLLLFDLINNALLEINDRSYTYFSKPFSFTYRTCRVHKGQCILEAVWARVSWCLSLMSKLDQSLEDIVGGDLSKDDGWMNLQPEAECVALDMEDMIFDDLLHELVSS